MIKAFVFDLGNTLIEYPEPEKLRENCARFACKMTVDRWLLDRMHELYLEDRQASLDKLHEATIEKALSRAIKEGSWRYAGMEPSDALSEIYHYGFGLHASPVAGAVRLMQEITTRGFKTGIVSNTPFPGYFFRYDLARFHLLNYFQTLVWSSEFGKRKPSPDIFNKALVNLEVAASEAVYVGDKFNRDVVGSSGAGMRPVWFDRKGQGGDYKGHRISALSELLQLKDLLV